MIAPILNQPWSEAEFEKERLERGIEFWSGGD
jgi:hypothetical protein